MDGAENLSRGARRSGEAGPGTARRGGRGGTRLEAKAGRPGAVSGEMEVTAADRAEDGSIRPAVLIGFADQLAVRAATAGGGGRTPFATETTLRQFHPCFDRVLAGVAEPLHVGPDAMLWQTSLFGAASGPCALVTQNFALAAAQAGTPDGGSGADRRDASEPAPAPAAAGDLPAGAQRREQIVAAAAEVIGRKGFARASVREIADAAGLHVPTLYQSVGSKEDLLEMVYMQTMDMVAVDVAEAAARHPSPSRRLAAVVASLVERGDRHRHRIGLLNRELRSLSPEARARVIERYRDLLRALGDIVAAGTAAGEFRPVSPVLAANLVEAACDMWPLRQFALRPIGLDTFTAGVTDLLVGALRA